MKSRESLLFLLYLVLYTFAANSFLLVFPYPHTLLLIVPIFLFINMFAGFFIHDTVRKRLKICFHGAYMLSVFELSWVLSTVYHIILSFVMLPNGWHSFVNSAVFCICAEALLFWNGIICVYLTSVQLGLKHRIVGAVCGMIPVVNLVVLNRIINICKKEVYFEVEREVKNRSRHEQRICDTKHPILMVHGVFFRDSKVLNYWGRIPEELELNGAKIYYGNHHSASSIKDSAMELAERIKEIVRETGCEKVNIIAHSKGGLDCRYAMKYLGMSEYVASLTTINTPHRGCAFADYLLTVLSEKTKNRIAAVYNTTLKKLGDSNPDFLEAVSNLTQSYCTKLDREMEMPQGIFCQSVGSVLKSAAGGKFPLNYSYNLVRYFDGENDGLVGVDSFEWGEKYTLLKKAGLRGISHADMVDLNRENIEGFDVREFYISLVSDLKNRGL